MNAYKLGWMLAAAGAAILCAAEEPLPQYALADCLAHGRAASAAVDAARRQEEIAEARIGETRAQALPDHG